MTLNFLSFRRAERKVPTCYVGIAKEPACRADPALAGEGLPFIERKIIEHQIVRLNTFHNAYMCH
jgi:hypothetical protein